MPECKKAASPHGSPAAPQTRADPRKAELPRRLTKHTHYEVEPEAKKSKTSNTLSTRTPRGSAGARGSRGLRPNDRKAELPLGLPAARPQRRAGVFIAGKSNS